MNNVNEYITAYADKVCVDKEDIVEILYSMCSNCPMAINLSDKLSLVFEFPDGKLVALFTLEIAPPSIALRLDNLMRSFAAYGYFPAEASELVSACSYCSDSKVGADIIYMDFKHTVENLNDIVDAIRTFTYNIYGGANEQ